MKKLIKGLRQFKTSYFSTHQELFEELCHAQKPRVLFIACSDSRVDPNLITQAGLGELFVIRNAGNIIPPFGATNGGEGATIEYAVQALDIRQIIICGHSHCGAMKGLMKLNSLKEELPLVHDWLKYAESTRRLVLDNYSSYQTEELLEVMIAENVLTQIENLRTYPVIHSKLYKGELNIYAWIYHIETGEVLAYDPESHAYVFPQSQIADAEEKPIGRFPACGVELSSEPLQQVEVKTPEQITITGREGFPMKQLSPEQTQRIYRGSTPRN